MEIVNIPIVIILYVALIFAFRNLSFVLLQINALGNIIKHTTKKAVKNTFKLKLLKYLGLYVMLLVFIFSILYVFQVIQAIDVLILVVLFHLAINFARKVIL